MSTTRRWRDLLRKILSEGQGVDHGRRGDDPRSITSRELVAYQTTWDMAAPCVTCPTRKIGKRFMFAEPAWILSGDNRLSTIEPFAKHMRQFSGDGQTLSGAYGPPFVDQLPYVTKTFRKDPASRQAVITLWRPRPMADPDLPCTVALQWLIRSDKLHCIVTMRSSDAWLGIPYDIVTFSCMSAAVLISLRHLFDLELGHLVITCGSQHLYERDWDAATQCAADTEDPPSWRLDPFEFKSRDDLIEALWNKARAP